MLSVRVGHSTDYLTGQVGRGGGQDYYLDAADSGEPPGVWWGDGAAELGLSGEVDADVMKSLYEKFMDPRDPRSRSDDPAERAKADRLGRPPRSYRTSEEIFEGLLQAERRRGLSTKRLDQLREQVAGEPDPKQALEDLLTRLRPILPERRDELWSAAQRKTSQAVMYIDVTWSPVKSFTVGQLACARMELEAQRAGDLVGARQWAWMRQQFDQALWAGNRAFLEYLQDHAGYSRVGRHAPKRPGRWIDAHMWTVASFHQHTSRTDDPQQHIHNAILNRVKCADGQYRTLDSKAIHRLKQGAGTVAEVAMAQDLTRRIGAEWTLRRDGIAYELVGVGQEEMDLFSGRAKAMSEPLRRMVDEFVERNGRQPVPIELDHLRRRASMRTRPRKSQIHETAEQELDRWEDQLKRRVSGGLDRVARAVRARYEATRSADRVARDQAGQRPVASFSPQGVIAEAVARCQEASPSWGRSELTRHLLMSLMVATRGDLGTDQVQRVVDSLADQVMRSRGRVVQVTGREPARSVPPAFQVASGRSAYQNPTGPRYATRDHVIAEQALRRAARLRSGLALDPSAVAEWLARDPMARRLSSDQAAAVYGLLTCPTAVSILVGPAGTGKSFTMGVMAKAWAEMAAGGRMIGLAPSQIATQVLGQDMADAINSDRERQLADEGMLAMNVSRWLAAQDRLHSGSPNPRDAPWLLTSADVIVVDEASMGTTPDLNRVKEYVRRAGARMIMTGDPRQLGAVGAGGGMAMLADGVATTYTLAEVRRFDREWERAASLRLREGDPTAAQEYDRRGQLNDCGTIEQAALDAAMSYVADTVNGHESIIVTTTNDEAARTSLLVREQLVKLGLVENASVRLGRDDTVAGVGDVVQARQNRWTIGPGVVNRERYRVVAHGEDGSLVVRPLSDPTLNITLPADYVRDHVTLGYASTAHAAQGMTVDVCHAIIATGMSPEALYVAMTRGRRRNTAHVATQPEGWDEPTGETGGRERMPVEQVMGQILERDRSETAAALVQIAQDVRQARSMATIQQRYEDAIRFVGRSRVEVWLDDLVVLGALNDNQRRSLAADEATESVSRLLRTCEQAGYDPQEVLATAVRERSLDGARSLAQVIHHRITERVGERPAPVGDHVGDRVPRGLPDEWQNYLDDLADAADSRRRELAEECAANPPAWAVEALGPVPDDVVGRAEWEHRAGVVAAHREATNWTDDSQAIGPAPAVDQDEPGTFATERRASWFAAWTALGRPEATAEESGLAEGQLRLRVRAWQREVAWADENAPNVNEQLRRAGRESVANRDTATLLAAKAAILDDPVRAELAGVDHDPAQAAAMRDEAEVLRTKADILDKVEQDLTHLAEVRAGWYVETAATREAAERAERELAQRGCDIDAEPDRVTAEEWLDIHDQAMRAEDAHRPVSDVDVHDTEREAAQVGDSAAGGAPVVHPPATTTGEQAERPAGGWTTGAGAGAGSPAVEVDRAARVRAARVRAVAEERVRSSRMPTDAETSAAVARARAVTDEIASRRSAEAIEALVGAEERQQRVSHEVAAARVRSALEAEEARLRDQALQRSRSAQAAAARDAGAGME